MCVHMGLQAQADASGSPCGCWLVLFTLVRLTMIDWVKLASVKGVKLAVRAVKACMPMRPASVQFPHHKSSCLKSIKPSEVGSRHETPCQDLPKAAMVGHIGTAGRLLNFIGDLVNGTESGMAEAHSLQDLREGQRTGETDRKASNGTWLVFDRRESVGAKTTPLTVQPGNTPCTAL